MIAKIVKINYYRYVIFFTNRSYVIISSSGNAYELLQYLLDEDYDTPFSYDEAS